MDAFKRKKPNAGFLPNPTRRLVLDRLPKVSIFITSLLLALTLVNYSIDAIGPQTLIIGDRKPFEYTNKLRIKGMNFNRSSLMGIGNFYNLDFVVYNCSSSDFLRVAVGATYEDGTWTSEPKVMFPYEESDIPLEKVEWKNYTINELTVLPLLYFTGYIPSPEYPTSLEFLVLDYSDGRGSYTVRARNGTYYDDTLKLFWTTQTIESWSKYKIRYYSTVFPENTTYVVTRHGDNRYIQVPASIKEKLEVKTHYATEGAETDLQRVQGIIEYLRENYVYNTIWRDAPHDQDPVQWFLFNEGKGISIHFNSAFVLMARSLGIPARVVGGYRMTPDQINFLSPEDRVVQAEVWCEEYGWVQFDATPEPVYELKGPSRRTVFSVGNRRKAEEETPVIGHSVSVIGLGLASFTILIVTAVIINRYMTREKAKEMNGENSIQDQIDDRLVIGFVEIEEGFPNVWESGNPITIQITSPISGLMTANVENRTYSFPDFKGRETLTENFELGSHQITGRLIGERTGSVVESRVTLRVVEYKEEVVQLFNRVLKDPSLAMQSWRLTAREIEFTLRESYPEIPVQVLDCITGLFEYADYSQHQLGRIEYLRFYEAIRELEEWIESEEE